jgi:hypothetical protein
VDNLTTDMLAAEPFRFKQGHLLQVCLIIRPRLLRPHFFCSIESVYHQPSYPCSTALSPDSVCVMGGEGGEGG